MQFIENDHSKLLGNAMDTYALRQRMTTTNIANLENPEYNKVSVSFEDQLREAEGRRLEEVTPEVVETDERPQLEDEMMEMTDTQIRVHVVTQALRQNTQMLRASITGRPR